MSDLLPATYSMKFYTNAKRLKLNKIQHKLSTFCKNYTSLKQEMLDLKALVSVSSLRTHLLDSIAATCQDDLFSPLQISKLMAN